MKASKVASVVAALLATDAKPTESAILAAILAADKKGKDEGGLGPVEIEKKDKAKDEFPPKDKADDEEMDDKAKDADMDDDMSEDEKDDEDKAKDEDVQPKKSASGNAGAGGAEPAKDKKGMDTAAIVRAALAERDALHDARRAVEPVLGVVAYDSAADVYRAALVKLGVTVDGIDPSAFPAMYKLAVDARNAATPRMASDAAAVKSMAAAIPGYDRLK